MSRNHQSVLYNLRVCWGFFCFFRFHIKVRSYGICLSFSDLLHEKYFKFLAAGWGECTYIQIIIIIKKNLNVLSIHVHACSVSQSCPTLCDPVTLCSPPGSSVHGSLQARMLEWVAISFSTQYTML